MLESARLQSKTIQFKFQPLRLDALIQDVALRVRVHNPTLEINLEFENMPPILAIAYVFPRFLKIYLSMPSSMRPALL